VALGSVALALQKPQPGSSKRSLQVLTESEAAVLEALADRLCPAVGAGAPGAKSIDLVSILDKRLVDVEEDAAQGLKLGLLLFDNALTGALFAERARPFSKLSPADQDRMIDNWRHSSVAFRRTLYRGLSYLVMAIYWGEPVTWARIGYSGPPDARGLRSAYADNLVDLEALRPQHGTEEI
jgi:hypothetical protein